MTTVPARLPRVPRNGLPLLVNGDRMNQPEFHRRYEHYPADVRFELVGGIVYQATPRPCRQGDYLASLSGVFGVYQSETPGVQAANFVTIILGEESEPQPDVSVCISPEYGGQSSLNDDDYVVGAPELLAEGGGTARGGLT